MLAGLIIGRNVTRSKNVLRFVDIFRSYYEINRLFVFFAGKSVEPKNLIFT